MYPKSLADLIESFRLLPGVGQKTAERYALTIYEADEQSVQEMIESLKGVKENVHDCKICGNLCEGDTCLVCEDPTRDASIIFVVESSKDVIAMEKADTYHGTYHVLHGLISTTKGIMPTDLNITSLLERAVNAKEIILATSATMDGETTAMYLAKLLEKRCPDVLVTRIAHGLPSGGMLDYADEITLHHALSDRKKM